MIILPFILFINNSRLILIFIRNLLKINNLVKFICFLPLVIITIISIQGRAQFLSELLNIFSIFDGNFNYCKEIDNSIDSRISYIVTSLKIIKQNLFFGIGPQNFDNYICIDQKYFTSETSLNISKYENFKELIENFSFKPSPFNHPHNLILHILSELGLVVSSFYFFNFINIIKEWQNQLRISSSKVSNLDQLLFLVWIFFLTNAIISESYVLSFNLSLFTGLIVSFIENKKEFKTIIPIESN